MSNFKILCPKCEEELTEKDFSENSKSLLNLQKIFKESEEEYIKTLKLKLIKELKNENDIATKLAVEKKSNELNASLSEKFNEKITDLNKEISKLKIQEKEYIENEKSNLTQINLAVEKKSNELNTSWQKQIDELKKELSEKQKTIAIIEAESDKNLSKSILENEQKFNKKIAELNKEITNLKIKEKEHKENEKSSTTKTELIIEKNKNELNTEWQNKVDQLNDIIKNLETENNKFKIMRPKTMGDNFENEFKSKLKEIFFDDEIEKITVLGKKADFKQTVINNDEKIGSIVYEIKSGENWEDKWIDKFALDIASQKANYGILVAKSFRKKYNDVPFEKVSGKNIFITDSFSFSFVGHILRFLIIKESLIKSQNANKKFTEKLQKLEDWKNHNFNSIMQQGINSLEKIVKEASKLENIKNNILSNTKIVSEKTINLITKEINELFTNENKDNLLLKQNQINISGEENVDVDLSINENLINQ